MTSVVLGINLHSPTAKLLFDREKTIIASFIYKNRSSDYIIASFVYTIRTCVYSFFLVKDNLSNKGKEVCNKSIATYLLIDWKEIKH